jgi:hypothetical protein
LAGLKDGEKASFAKLLSIRAAGFRDSIRVNQKQIVGIKNRFVKENFSTVPQGRDR